MSVTPDIHISPSVITGGFSKSLEGLRSDASSVSKLLITVVVYNNLDFTFSVSMLQLTGCPPQASSLYHPQFFAVSSTVIASPRAMSSPSSLSLSASFNRAYTFGPLSCCPTNLVYHVVLRFPPRVSMCAPSPPFTLVLSLSSRIHTVYLISVIQVILSLSSCRCLRTSSLSSSTSTSRSTASKRRRSSAPREGVLP
jgi:hypothetical protein